MLLSQVPSFFKSRRDALMKMHPESAFIFPSASELLRNPDVTHQFRQESNFYYLTGFEEPESFLLLLPQSQVSSKNYRMVLFVRHRDPEREMWEGARYGTEGALKIFGADEAYVVSEFDKKLPELLNDVKQVYYRLGLNEATDRRIIRSLDAYRRSLGRTGKALLPICDPNDAVAEMRLFKTAEEIAIMRKAGSASARAFKKIVEQVKPGMNEAEVSSSLEYEFRKNGCQRVGFGTIVAGGKNAACLHYTANNEPLKDRELLLIDAGGEVDYYSADITRTFPIGKKFTEGQAKLYDLVLKSQIAAIEMTKPGTTLAEIHKHVCEILLDGCISLGLLKGDREQLLRDGAIKRFYPHNTSHWLGIDVHDVGFYSKNGAPRPLEPGMVFTIEPGFYVQPGDYDVPAEFRNIGIRIEDDVLVTTQGCEVLTAEVPKKRSELEALKG